MKNKRKNLLQGKRKWFLLLSVFLVTVLGIYVKGIYTGAAENSGNYYIFYSDNEDNKSALTMTDSQITVSIKSDTEDVERDADIDWIVANKDKDDKNTIVTVTPDVNDKRVAVINVVSPGRVNLVAQIKRDNGVDTAQRDIIVPVDINNTTTGSNGFFKEYLEEDSVNNATLMLDINDPSRSSRLLKLKLGDASNVVGWETADDHVATVDENGLVTAVGAGMTTITAFHKNDNYGLVPDSINVIVQPRFLDSSQSSTVVTEYEDIYTVYTNAQRASNLIWVIKDQTGNELVNTLTGLTSQKVSITPSKVDGSCKVTGYSAEYTLELYPMNRENNMNLIQNQNKVPKYVPGSSTLVYNAYFTFPTGNVNVGDQFNIYEHTNVENVAANFRITTEVSGDFNASTGVVTFSQAGSYSIQIKKYSASQIPSKVDVFNTTVNVNSSLVNVIDKTMLVGETDELVARFTSAVDEQYEISFDTSNEKIVKINQAINGRCSIVGVAKGSATITAKVQVADGVIKTCAWNIRVLDSLTATISPSSETLNIGDTLLLGVKYSSDYTEGLDVRWESSQPDVVEIVENTDSKNSVMIRALAPGVSEIVLLNKLNQKLAYAQITVRRPLTQIKFNKTEISVVLKPGVQLSESLIVSYFPDNATTKDLIWESENSKVASVDGATGLVKFLSAGQTKIKATSTIDSQVFAECKIYVYQQISSIKLNKTQVTMNTNDTVDIVATVSPNQYILNEDMILSWESSNTKIATVSGTGIVGSIKAVSPGNATITATTTSGKKATVEITVLQLPTALKVSTSDLTLEVGQSKVLELAYTPTTTTNKKVTWASMDESIVKVEADGTVKAISAGPTGKTTVQLAVTAENGVHTTCKVTVVQPITDMKLNYTKKSVVVGKTFKLYPTFTPTNAFDQTVTYASMDSSVATVDKEGTIKGIKGGTTLVSVTSNSTGKMIYCMVTVEEKITKITLNKTSYKLGLKKTYRLKPTIASNYSSNKKLKWTTSNKKYVTVTSSGKIKGVKLGRATITVRATDGSGAKATCSVRVVRPVTSISLNKSYIKLVEGKTTKIKATVKPKNATYKNVTYRSSNDEIALIDSKGKIIALQEGKVTITAKAQDSSGKSAKCIVQIVKETPATGITIPNKETTMVVGESDTLDKIVTPHNTSDAFKWTSDNSKIVSINKSTGRMKALRTGNATITVSTTSGKTATCKVTVVGLNRTKLVMEQYDTYQLSIVGASDTVRWDVANPKIARVSSTGVISARKKGTTTVTAIIRGRRMNCKVTVTDIKK